MGYEFLNHTADVAVELSAPTREGLFAEALRAFTDTLTDPKKVDGDETHRLEVSAEDLPGLMVEWLGELVYRFEVDGLLFARAKVAIEEGADGGWRLVAEAAGESYDEEVHPLEVQVKGVTYHGLEVREEPGGDGWYGRVIFDV